LPVKPATVVKPTPYVFVVDGMLYGGNPAEID
jgi:hypothetical protein